MSEITVQLISAVENGRLESVRDLLNQHGLDDSEGYVPLCKSIILKYTEITKLLLSNGSRVNSKKNPSNTPLHLAIQNGDIEIVELLLNNDADMNAMNEDDWTPFLSAVSMDNEEIVDLLLSKGYRLNHYICIKPLHVAVEHGLYKMTEQLLQLEAYVDDTFHSTDDLTVLHRAVKTADSSIVELLLKHGAKVDSKTTGGLTPMHFASEIGNVKIIKLLLSSNAEVNARSNNMLTPLYLAVQNCHIEAAKCLMDNGASIEGEFKNGETVVVENLLNYGFSVTPDNINDTVLLHTAIALGYMKIIEDLIKHGLNLALNKEENSIILHIAIKYKQVDIAKLLLTHGADVNATDKAGKPAIYYSTENSDVVMTKLLLSHGASVQKNPELLTIATTNVCKEIVEMLLQKKVDIEATNEAGWTALHLNADRYRGSVRLYDEPHMQIKEEIAKLLLSMGANVNAKTKKDNLTALLIACNSGITNIVKVLLEYKADVNCVSNVCSHLRFDTEDGDTALHLLARTGHTQAVKMLLQNGADVYSKNSRGSTPLHEASKGNNPEIVSILLEYGSHIDSKDIDGKTPLFHATDGPRAQVVEILLNNGSDINIFDKYYSTAIDIYDRSSFVSDESYLEELFEFEYGYLYKLVRLHLIMLKTANLYVREKDMILMSNEDDSTRIHKKNCEDEVKKLKLEKIVANNKLSFYDILTENIHSLVKYARNEDIVRVFESDNYKTKFPIYAPIIKRNFLKGIQRSLLLEKAQMFLKYLIQLPYDCYDNILIYLSNADLENIINVSKMP